MRERTEDVPLLIRHFLGIYSEENDKPVATIGPAAMEVLLDYSWPGNVRELQNVIERAVVLSRSETLNADSLPPSVRRKDGVSVPSASLPEGGISLKEAISSYERQLIIKALQASGGVQKRSRRASERQNRRRSTR